MSDYCQIVCAGEREGEREKKNARKMEEKSSLKEKERMLAYGGVAEREIEAQKSERERERERAGGVMESSGHVQSL